MATESTYSVVVGSVTTISAVSSAIATDEMEENGKEMDKKTAKTRDAPETSCGRKKDNKNDAKKLSKKKKRRRLGNNVPCGADVHKPPIDDRRLFSLCAQSAN